MISPRSSPRFLRRSTTPTVGVSSGPPPLPPRKSSPTLEHTPLNEAQSALDLSQPANPVPPIAKSNSMHEIFTAKEHVLELSAPETIYGIIDSRYNFCNIDSKSRFQSAVSSGNKNQTHHSDQEICYISKEPPYENIQIDLPPKGNPLTAKGPGSVSYENLNMDYIKQLVSEGYSKDAVIRALGITRNNIDMACDILHEFGTKHG